MVTEREAMNALAALPRMTVTIHPLFAMILAMSLPEIVSIPIPGDHGAFIRREAVSFVKAMRDSLPPEARELMGTLNNGD